jgi:hypothetical protein
VDRQGAHGARDHVDVAVELGGGVDLEVDGAVGPLAGAQGLHLGLEHRPGGVGGQRRRHLGQGWAKAPAAAHVTRFTHSASCDRSPRQSSPKRSESAATTTRPAPCSATARSGAPGAEDARPARASARARPGLELERGGPVEAGGIDAREQVHPVAAGARSARTQCGAPP